MMKLQLFRSLWTTGGDLLRALGDVEKGLFDGIEGPCPLDQSLGGIPFIAEITTGGSYVPIPRLSLEEHVEDFRCKAELAMEAQPLFITSLAGRDAWSVAEAVEFFGQVMRIAANLGVTVSFETHRSRALFTPWSTAEILRQLPEMRITCDFSHWCCIAERLVIDEEPEILALCAERARHVHARVGYDQGAQVPHPAAPEHAADLEAHLRWWRALWQKATRDTFTITPEFGPDGYLHRLPFTGMPVGDLDEINRWMAQRLRQEFAPSP